MVILMAIVALSSFAQAVFLLFIWRALLGSNKVAIKLTSEITRLERQFNMLSSILRDNATETRDLRDAIKSNEPKHS